MTKRDLTALTLAAALLAPLTALAFQGAAAEPARMASHAEGSADPFLRGVQQLGLDDATEEAVLDVLHAAAADRDQLRQEERAAREEMTALMSADAPDREAVLAQHQALSELISDLRRVDLVMILDVRALLTPEQWRALAAQLPPPPGPRGGPAPRGVGGGAPPQR